MSTFGISEAAELLGVSADTVRRWIDSGRLPAERELNGHRRVAGADLAAFAAAQRDTAEHQRAGAVSSARNRFRGIVTQVVRGRRVGHRCRVGGHRGRVCLARVTRARRSVAVRSGARSFAIHLRGLRRGRYRLSLTAVDRAGHRSRTVSFAITLT